MKGAVQRFAQLSVWGALGFLFFITYNTIGPLVGWFPFGYQPVYGTIGFTEILVGTAAISFIISWLAFHAAESEGFKKGFEAAKKAVQGNSK